MTGKLDAGAQFPTLALELVNDGRIKLPDEIDSAYLVLLFYRGHW